MRSVFILALSALSTATMLVACGGSDSVAPTTITGSAVKGPVNGATVTIKKASDGSVVGTTTTGTGGAYTVSVPYQGDVIVEVSGGTYTDEATGATTALASPMKAVLTTSGTAVTGVVTPLTTMAFTASFPTGTGVNTTAFKTAASNLATQFQLTGVDLTTATPVVTGTTNAYGNALKAVSQYLKDNQGTTLAALTNQSLTAAEWTNFSGKFSTAYQTANNQTVTYSINGNTITSSVSGAGAGGSTVTTTTNGNNTTVTGTGAGGGTGTCGVKASGNISQIFNGQTINTPVNLDICVTGIAAGSCSASNAQLSQTLAGQQGLSGAVNLNYTYSASCAAGAMNVALL